MKKRFFEGSTTAISFSRAELHFARCSCSSFSQARYKVTDLESTALVFSSSTAYFTTILIKRRGWQKESAFIWPTGLMVSIIMNLGTLWKDVKANAARRKIPSLQYTPKSWAICLSKLGFYYSNVALNFRCFLQFLMSPQLYKCISLMVFLFKTIQARICEEVLHFPLLWRRESSLK